MQIEPEDPGEQLYTVLWYRVGAEDGAPIYTYDARSSRDSEAPAHWSEDPPRGFGSRARLVVSPHPAQLVITRQGMLGLHTTTQRLELGLAELPKHARIRDNRWKI